MKTEKTKSRKTTENRKMSDYSLMVYPLLLDIKFNKKNYENKSGSAIKKSRRREVGNR